MGFPACAKIGMSVNSTAESHQTGFGGKRLSRIGEHQLLSAAYLASRQSRSINFVVGTRHDKYKNVFHK